ncbi:MAG TPA: bifunctional riboflavin kinase/FAD synthetase [Chthoniobacteraceae bacterium]|nr:bifunctional riboflavin kinase/FAD synthetase [Chthoniobacteraceae bacterium]
MQTMDSIAQLATVPGPVCLAVGVFDGVHLGHQAVIGRALADAEAFGGNAVVVTFDPHPMRVLRPEHAPRLLTSTLHKRLLLERVGVRHLLVLPFTAEFAGMEAQTFVHALAEACRPLRTICVGHTWSFGKGRAGNLELLRKMGDQLGFDEIGMEAVELDGEIVSSTLIRACVEGGELEKAGRLLGRRFSILGTVKRGRQLGKTLGFPTANLSAHNEQYPPNGVYAVEARLPDAGGEGALLQGVVNIGVRPTLREPGGERLLELHLFDFDDDLYGRNVEVFFHRFLRPEKTFPDLDALTAQIGCDVLKARRALAS